MKETPAEKNKLGLWTSTSLIVGNMIGAGIFLAPAALASFGSVSILGWVISAIGCFFLVKVFGNLSKLFPNITGGPYAYTRRGFGDYMGFSIAWGYFLAVSCANAAITIGFVSALSTFIPVLSTNTLSAIGTGLATIWLLTWVNNRGIRTSGTVQLVTTILKLIPLLLVAFGGLFFIKAENFPAFNNSGTSLFAALSSTVTFTMFAYVGIESATIPAEKVQNPQQTIPRATLIGLLIVTVVYVLGTVSVMGIIPSAQFAKDSYSLRGCSCYYVGRKCPLLDKRRRGNRGIRSVEWLDAGAGATTLRYCKRQFIPEGFQQGKQKRRSLCGYAFQ